VPPIRDRRDAVELDQLSLAVALLVLAPEDALAIRRVEIGAASRLGTALCDSLHSIRGSEHLRVPTYRSSGFVTTSST
jgi:hypothetical protein